jgi:hypothetical protein
MSQSSLVCTLTASAGTTYNASNLIKSGSTIAQGSAVTFNATFNGIPGSATYLAFSYFFSNNVSLGNDVQIDPYKKTATFTTSSLSAGYNEISAKYGSRAPLPMNAASYNPFVLIVTQPSSTSTPTLSTNVNGAPVGTSVAITAKVPTAGTITFYDAGVSIGSANASFPSYTAVLNTNTLRTGLHYLTASYTSITGIVFTSAKFMQSVKSTISIVFPSVLSTNTFGTSLNITAVASDSNGSSVTPTGTMNFTDSMAGYLGTATASSNGSFNLVVSPNVLSTGVHTISALYSGDSNYAPRTTSSFVETILPGMVQSSITMIPSVENIVQGQSVTFTATVIPSTATGNVTFLDQTSGKVLGTASLNSSGIAPLTTTSIAAGYYNVYAQYAGDSNTRGSSSSPGSFNVAAGNQATTITLTSSPNPAPANASVTFTATTSAVTATGTISFAEVPNTLGSAPLDSTGTATITLSNLSPGTHQVTAFYNGNSVYNSANSTALSQTIIPPPAATITLTSSANPVTVGASTTFTATVLPKTATGTVVFSQGQTVLGSAALSSATGIATLTSEALPIGTLPITATYNGDQFNGAATTNVLNEVVAPLPPQITTPSFPSAEIIAIVIVLLITLLIGGWFLLARNSKTIKSQNVVIARSEPKVT